MYKLDPTTPLLLSLSVLLFVIKQGSALPLPDLIPPPTNPQYSTNLPNTPKLFFTLLLSKIACQAPKRPKTPQHTLNKQDKTFPKVVFSYGQSGIIKLEIEKAPAPAGAFSVSSTIHASKSFISNILAVSPMVARF
jgi:hypothetical protein